MSLSFSFLGYTTVDTLTDLSGSIFIIPPTDLVYGTKGIANALDECLSTGTVATYPNDGNPRATDESGRLVYETEYKELLEECQAALDWQTECNPDGDFEECCFWVRVNFE